MRLDHVVLDGPLKYLREASLGDEPHIFGADLSVPEDDMVDDPDGLVSPVLGADLEEAFKLLFFLGRE